MRKILEVFILVLVLGALPFAQATGQVTTASISGTVRTADAQALEGATVTAVHVPSGTRYVVVSGKNGVYTFANVRVGGPFSISVSYAGYENKEEKDIYTSLGNTTTVDFAMSAGSATLSDVVVASTARSSLINSRKNGASTTLGTQTINTVPVINRTINDVTKYNAYSNGRSFAGQDPRFNNFTIDGSVFNNGFGLGSSAIAGGRTGTTAISLDALEELQINIAPFDIRQSGFAGAGINAVTRSGTNDVNGSAYYLWNNRNLAGKKADTSEVPKTPFESKTYGFRVGGPIIKNKLFFFINGESVRSTRPALDYVADKPGAVGNISRTTAADLEDLKSFMQTNFNYDMGAIDNFNNEVKSDKFLVRLDYNISDKHKLTVRYSHHNSESDVIVSNSSSGNLAGNGNRQNLPLAISAQNNGYKIQDNTRSIVAELNSTFGRKFSNQFLATYNKQIEDRKYRTDIFPTVDILKDGSTYTSLGFDPFTPNNRLDYATINFTDNFTWFAGKHTLVAGYSFEAFKSNNLFVPSSNGVWVFNSIEDFKTAALAYNANPNLETSPVAIGRFNYRYSLLPEGELPWQVFKTNTHSLYFQDEFKATRNFRITGGIRFDYVSIPNTAEKYFNPVVDTIDFKTPDGQNYHVNTGITPKSRIYVSPRIGFNWNVKGNSSLIIRGGTGIFLSRIPYVLISNQLGNNGVNTGVLNITGDAAANYPFTLDPSRYRPANTDITALSGYAINASDPNLKFPQVWKTNLGIDQKLPGGLVATIEGIFNKNINALNYIDANLNAPTGKFNAGADTRDVYPAFGLSGSAATAARFINSKVSNAYVLTNNDKGYSYSLTAKLEKTFVRHWGGMLGYTYAKAKDVSFVASTVNANVPTIYGVNYLTNAYSDNDLRHRIVSNISYRINYGKKVGGATTLTLGFIAASGNKLSYILSNDLNGDGQINDLIYIPKSASELKFVDITSSGTVLYTAAQQQTAFDAYINNNKYLSERRGSYAERNGAALPWLKRLDLSAEQDFIVRTGKNNKPNTLRFRIDILNFTNLISQKWGVAQISTTASPLTFAGKDAVTGEPTYRLATQNANGSTILLRDSFVKSRTIDDVYQIQLGIRYIFGN
ncbi:TonB-dependent receptor [Panacibacter sp. DH6]|uniref:TonB-dependent receptor n=1 Tax=Panacibacter microcysteis TaxID=2793269 RepID=A0A931GYI1_9BACT|nr:TonB-dependent receptor [Panacibacter microcysteis]MBG9376122.1 TonB-dependent receptor [Panacibacter microcysteis]